MDQIELVFGEEEALVADFEIATRRLRLWMLGSPATVITTGNGLGPDLTKPVPYVMARRRARETRFATLLEPYGGTAPAVTGFRQAAEGQWIVTGHGWEDTIEFGSGGVRYFRK